MASVVLCGIVGLVPVGASAVEAGGTVGEQSVSVEVESEGEKKSERLYRTKTGECYHKEGCHHLRKSKIKVSEEEIIEAELRPCQKCCEKTASR